MTSNEKNAEFRVEWVQDQFGRTYRVVNRQSRVVTTGDQRHCQEFVLLMWRRKQIGR
jgi:predicted 3-demethylubiquinone-9 3-methyltransferase (glyoxalase superfamily)